MVGLHTRKGTGWVKSARNRLNWDENTSVAGYMFERLFIRFRRKNKRGGGGDKFVA